MKNNNESLPLANTMAQNVHKAGGLFIVCGFCLQIPSSVPTISFRIFGKPGRE